MLPKKKENLFVLKSFSLQNKTSNICIFILEAATKSSPHPCSHYFQASASSMKLDKRKYTSTTLPTPVPLTCPFQHEHHRELTEATEEMPSEHNSSVGYFSHGRLKIVITEGIVYRFLEIVLVLQRYS